MDCIAYFKLPKVLRRLYEGPLASKAASKQRSNFDGGRAWQTGDRNIKGQCPTVKAIRAPGRMASAQEAETTPA